jgi:hypothetical protein
VSALPNEGQFLPEVKEVMRQDAWDPDLKFPWRRIKAVWDGYWDHDKPLLVEKSPPNLLRTDEISQHFSPIYFLLMVRNPYAHCEGLMRRNNWDAHRAVNFTVRCLRLQKENVNKLEHMLRFTYEELVENPKVVSKRIQSFIPQIGELKYAESFKVHSMDGVVERGIVDLNQRKIHSLSINDLKQINEVLKENADIMDFWGYKYYEPSLRHAFAFIGTRSSLLATSALSKGSRGFAKLAKRLTRSST